MRKVCGYKSLNGCFYEKKGDCEIADSRYKVKQIKDKLDDFDSELYRYLFHGYSNYSVKEQEIWYKHEEDLMRRITKKVLLHSDDFIEVIKKKEELKDELDQLRKKLKYHKWWLKLKWW